MALSSAITVFIDEGGDPGVKGGLRFLNSNYEWFTLGAYVTRTSNVGRPVEVVQDILSAVKGGQRPDLHYAKLSAPNRLLACQKTAASPARAFCFSSHKRNSANM